MKTKLKDLITELERIRKEYKKEYGKEPIIWSIDAFSDVESIELCHSYRKSKTGGYTADDIEEYDLF